VSRADRSLLFAQAAYDGREPRENDLVIEPASLRVDGLAQVMSDRGIRRLCVRYTAGSYVSSAETEDADGDGISKDLAESIAQAISAAVAS